MSRVSSVINDRRSGARGCATPTPAPSSAAPTRRPPILVSAFRTPPQYIELQPYPLQCLLTQKDCMHWPQIISPSFAGTPHSDFAGAHWDGRSHPASIIRLLRTPVPLAPRKPYFRTETHCNGRRRGRALPSRSVLGPLSHCPVPHVRRKLEITGDTPRTSSPAGQLFCRRIY